MYRGIPIQFYQPSFAKFLRVARADVVQIDLKPEDYSTMHSLLHSSSVLFKDEAFRSNKGVLDKAVRRAIPALDFS
jgi:hypothetical protein